MSRHGRARRWYRRLLRAYPPAHRARYGAEMEEAFITLLRLDGDRAGWLGVARCWLGAVWDALTRGAAARIGWTGRIDTGRGGDMLGTIWADIRYAARALRRRPVFAGTAVLTIALGIGANASVFAVVDGFLFTPLPYEEPEELVALWAAKPSLGWSNTDVNPRDAWEWRERVRALEDVAVLNPDGLNLTGGDAPELVSAIRMTPNTLGVLGRAPARGRDFTEEEMGEGRDGVAILMDGFWERRFGRDPAVLGSTLVLDGKQHVVVGIMGPDFVFLEDRPDVLVPLDFDPATAERGGHYAEAVGRLAPGVTVDQAEAELDAVAADMAAEYPENDGWTADMVPMHTELVGPVALRASMVLMGAVGFILLMACVNVANLLLARAGGRTREIAVRAALGAGRGRLARQLLTESFVIALAGGLLGLALAQAGFRAIVATLPPELPPVFSFGMDGSVIAFTAAITGGAALLFGLLPSLRASSAGGSELRGGGRGGTSRRAGRFGSALVVMQTAMAVVLLIGGGLLMKSISGMRGQEFGFDPENALALRVSPPQQEYPDKAASDAFWEDVTRRVEALPGVVHAGTAQNHPLMGSNWGGTVEIAGRPPSDDEGLAVRLTYASPGLFDALGVRVVQGRALTPEDGVPGDESARNLLVNEAFVRQYLGPQDDPLAITLVFSGLEVAIVGVLGDIVERAVDRAPGPALYVPIGIAEVRTRSLVVRTAGDPLEHLPAIQDAVWAVDPDLPLYGVETLEALVDRRIGGFAVIGYLMGVFALLSLLLGAVGIYGVTAYAAGQRTGEIGVRIAMGAERSDVVRMVVGQGAARAVLGLVIGLGLAFLMGGALSGLLVGVSPTDPVTWGGVTVTLAAVSVLGLYLPARRVARTDPVRALGAD